jgi:hypothetical protein
LLVLPHRSFIVLPGVDSSKLTSGSTGGTGLVDPAEHLTGWGLHTRLASSPWA